MKRMVFVLLILITLSIAPSVALAVDSCPVCDGAASDHYGTKTGAQFARGVTNTGLCWVELINQPVKETKASGNVLLGVGKGVGHTCIRLVQGVGEIVTCPMPKAKDGHYTQIAKDCPLGVMGMTDR